MDYDFNRECLQADINHGINPREWDDDDKQFYMEKLVPRGLYVYDNDNNIVDFDQYKLLDFVNSK